MKMRSRQIIWQLFLILVVLIPAVAFGGGTRVWELAGFAELDKGEPDGTAVSSRGEVSLGLSARQLDLSDVGLVWSSAQDSKGRVFLGTGYDGKIFRVDGNKVVEVAQTGQLIVTALNFDKKGDLYVATLPDAVIWKVAAPSKVREGKPAKAEKWATFPEETKHVWALAFSKNGRTLYAGTGPMGVVYAIGTDRKPKVYLDTEEEHILSLAITSQDELMAGTSPKAKLFRITGPGRSSALADFDATEVKAIAVTKGAIFVAVNKFTRPPAVPNKKKSIIKTTGSSSPKKNKSEVGDGRLYRLREDGQTEKLWERKKSHVTSLATTDDGVLFAGLGAQGKVISISKDRTIRTELDLSQRQVLTLVADDDLKMATTGDAGAVYSVARARAKEAVYLSPPLDAKVVSSWGRASWFATGKLKLQSRTGNTVQPDDSWSDWSKPIALKALVSSPPARYLQLRASWAADKDAVLTSTQLAYKQANMRAIVIDLNPDSPFPAGKKITKKKGSSKVKVSTRTIALWPAPKSNKKLELRWSVDNPDEDVLRYTLWYRAVKESLWRPILRDDDVLKKKKYSWNTESVPEGWYQVRITADDSPDNDKREVLSDEFVSVPVLVDNHQPSVSRLKFAKGRISGSGADSFSEIVGIEYSVDAQPWMPVFCDDGVFDESKEEFDFELDGSLGAGPHAVAVRVFDRAGNMGSDEIHIQITK
jgi:hypothetical protein